MKNYLLSIVLFYISVSLFAQTAIVAEYKMDGNGKDASPNMFDATVFGATPTMDRFGNIDGALSFDGTDDYLEVLNQSMLNFGICDFAISLWIKTSSNSMQMLVHNGSDGFDPQYWLRLKDFSSSAIDLKFLTSDGIPSSPNVTYNNPYIYDNNWHHILVQRKSLDHQVYFDGALVSNFIGSQIKNIINMENMLIGAQHPTPASGFPTIHNFFNGSMDDLVFYKGALSTEEVETVFNETPTSTIDVKTMADNIVIFPNPTSDILQINDYPSTTIKNVKIVDGSGKTVLHFLQLTDNQIDVSVLAEGIYFVVFEFQGNFITKKILKK